MAGEEQRGERRLRWPQVLTDRYSQWVEAPSRRSRPGPYPELLAAATWVKTGVPSQECVSPQKGLGLP